MKRHATTLLWIGVLALLVSAVAGWQWWRGVAVEAVTLRSAPLVRTLQFSARVATLSRVEIGSTVTARVAQVLVDEGAQVRQGEVLVQLEADEQRAALAQAVAAEQQAQARVAGLRSSGRSVANAALAQAEATLTAARKSFQRAQQLVAEGFYSAAQLDDARRALGVAQAQQGSARAQVQANADAGTEVLQAQAQAALAQAATAAARARLAQLALRSPTDARVLSIAPAVDAQRGAIEVKFVLDGAALCRAGVVDCPGSGCAARRD